MIDTTKPLILIITLFVLLADNKNNAMDANRNLSQSPPAKNLRRRLSHAHNAEKLADIDVLIVNTHTKERAERYTCALGRLRSLDTTLRQDQIGEKSHIGESALKKAQRLSAARNNLMEWKFKFQHQELMQKQVNTEQQSLLVDLESIIKFQRMLLQDQSNLIATLLNDQEISEQEIIFQHTKTIILNH